MCCKSARPISSLTSASHRLRYAVSIYKRAWGLTIRWPERQRNRTCDSRDCSNHGGLRVASQALLQEPCEDRVTVGNKLLFLLPTLALGRIGEGSNDLAECCERLVDVGTLLEPRALGSALLHMAPTVAPVDACRSLPARSTSEILDTFSPTILDCGSRRFWVSWDVSAASPAAHDDGKHGVRARRRLVHVGRRDCPGLRVSHCRRPPLALLPSSMSVIICASFSTTSLLRSSTYGPSDGCSRTLRLPLFLGFSRSRTLMSAPARVPHGRPPPTSHCRFRCTTPRPCTSGSGPCSPVALHGGTAPRSRVE